MSDYSEPRSWKGSLKSLLVHIPIGHQRASSKEGQEEHKFEKIQTQGMLKSAKMAYDGIMAQIYEFLCNLLAGDPQAQWDHICCKMHNQDAWASLNGEKHKGKHPHT